MDEILRNILATVITKEVFIAQQPKKLLLDIDNGTGFKIKVYKTLDLMCLLKRC